MMHVKQIRNMIDNGSYDEALSTIDNLLLLGPHNLDALKLKAFLLEGKGYFHDALRVWLHVAQVAPDDEDAIAYVQTKQLEDKEHYYFTDELPDGGRRFLARNHGGQTQSGHRQSLPRRHRDHPQAGTKLNQHRSYATYRSYAAYRSYPPPGALPC